MAQTLKERRVTSSKRRNKDNVQFRTRDGVLLLASIGIVVALIFVLVYFVWYLPMEKAIH